MKINLSLQLEETTKDVMLHVRISQEHSDILDTLAKKYKVSVSKIVRALLKKALEK